MSKLSNLLNKYHKTVEFLGEEIKVKPLGVNMLDKLLLLEDEKTDATTKAKIIREITKEILIDNFPDMTDDEFNQIPLTELIKILQAMQE